ncbi:MAG: O-antigen ligase family protein [Acidobacteriota bacterium]
MTHASGLREPYVGPLQKVAFLALLLFLFLLHSRVFDLAFSKLHIPILTLYIAVAAALLGGGFFRAFSNRIGILLLMMTGWMMLAVPFSVWPGGSALIVRNWGKMMLVYVVTAGLISTFGQFRRTIHVLAFAILVLAVTALAFGDTAQGRLVLARGRFANPNDLGQILLMGFPFWWYIATNRKLKRSRRVLAILALIPIFTAMAKTGSRGALIAAAAVGLVLFWRSSVSRKILIAVGVLILVTFAAVFLPEATKARYFTFFSSNETDLRDDIEADIETSAVSSTQSRWNLLKDSIALTWLHPMFGVGPGQFPAAQDQYSWKVRNHKGHWQVTHNTFTEFSSEDGIPVLIFYCLALYFAFRSARLPKGAPPGDGGEAASASFCLRLSLLSYLVSSMFGSFAYQTQFIVLAGLSVAFARVGGGELARAAQSKTAQQPQLVYMARGARA